MKVSSPLEAATFVRAAPTKVESRGDGGGSGAGYGGGSQKKKDESSEDSDAEAYDRAAVDAKTLQAVVTAFRQDAQTQSSGLDASVEGRGPGLRVVLKDGSGAVVRQFTGEEFLKVREAATDGRRSGKLLDRKL